MRQTLTRKLAAELKERIAAMPHGARLASTRALARERNLSRNTVISAYEQLASEGLVESRRGSGTRVLRRTTPRDWRDLLAGSRFPARQAPLPNPDGAPLFLFTSLAPNTR
ncbi:MAG: winged helix-turn-helix domain-containing protein [Bryobacteraceae bacterium]|nr:winged helix-turn-helix domain-containing protein [Bryobacteraceae bacterium]